MAHTESENTLSDLEQPYEKNEIGIKGIAYFTIGLALLIVITFGLMWILLEWVLEADAKETKSSDNPMMLSDIERLPPEPRLQAAPGFQIRTQTGRINLELKAPQAEYWALRDQWNADLRDGQRDPETGALIAMPIEAAKERFLEMPIKAKTGAEAEQAARDSMKFYSDASSGRVTTLRRR
jgi:hypothetical protein